MGWIDLLRFFAALIFVLSLMGGLAFALKKAGLSRGSVLTSGKKRLKTLEILPLDARRKIVLVQRDNEQHLILLGPNNDTVVETGIKANDKE